MNSCHLNETDKEPLLISSRTEKDEEQSNYPLWSELPDLALENIYSFLSRRDQRNMSLVCQNWRKEFSAPKLWRRMKFVFPDLDNGTEVCPDVVCARRFGYMFHHVEIVFEGEPPPFLPLPSVTVLRQLTFFMEAVTRRSQLLSISFDIYLYMRFVDAELYSDFYLAMFNLIKSQEKLQYVDFISSRFEIAEVTEILKTIFANNSKTLRYLHLPISDLHELPDEFADIPVDEDLNFQLLMNLEVLKIEYTQVIQNMLLSFYKYSNRVDIRERRGRLKMIKLFCDCKRVDSYLRIQTSMWNYLMRIFPDISIHLKFISTCDATSLSRAIVPRMPLKVLEFCSENEFSPGKDAGTLLRHITSCEVNTSLEELIITLFPREGPNFAPDLINFTSVCLKLKRLELSFGYPIAALDIVFKSWLENRPTTLKIVKITLRRSAEETLLFKNLYDLYSPLLQSVNIELFIYVKLEDETVHISNV